MIAGNSICTPAINRQTRAIRNGLWTSYINHRARSYGVPEEESVRQRDAAADDIGNLHLLEEARIRALEDELEAVKNELINTSHANHQLERFAESIGAEINEVTGLWHMPTGKPPCPRCVDRERFAPPPRRDPLKEQLAAQIATEVAERRMGGYPRGQWYAGE